MTLRVGVLGAGGKMGRTVCEAVAADPDLDLVGVVDPGAEGRELFGLRCGFGAETLAEAEAEAAVDFTLAEAARKNVRFCTDHGIHCVVGTTGLSDEDLAEFRRWAESGDANVFVAPNFSVGAVLAMHFSALAARHLGSCEVVELHHNEKLDAPSGTALRTARGVAEAWREHGRPPGGEPASGEEEKVPGARGADVDGVRVHAVRLQGIVAHQEVVLGGPGQMLTIRHDSIDRTSFMPGVLMAVKAVGSRPGLTVGLEALLRLA